MNNGSNWKDADEFCQGAFGGFVRDVSPYTKIVAELMEHSTVRERKRCADEIERLRKALAEINGHAVCAYMADENECRLMLQNCAVISNEALQET